MKILYTLLYGIVFTLNLPLWLLKGAFHKKYYHTFKSRLLGPGKMLPKFSGKPRVWIWALSLGEVISSEELVKAFINEGAEVFISSTTQNGLKAAKNLYPNLMVVPSPFDFEISTRRFIKMTDPDMMVLIETDLWPGIINKLKLKKIPQFLVSARLSPKSFKGYSKIKFFWKHVLNSFQAIATQTSEDRDRFIEIGANDEKIFVTGNLKFDKKIIESGNDFKNSLLKQAGWPTENCRWLVAGSTHAGEEIIITECFEKLLKDFPNLKLLIAPRDKVSFEAIWQYLISKKLKVAKRSLPQKSDLDAQVFLLDTLGELANFYEIADLAIIGKSWPGKHEGGGHNPLEAASRGIPTVFGPRTHNFRWMCQALISVGGAMRSHDEADLYPILSDLLASPDKLQKMGENSLNFVKRHQGAVDRTMKIIEPYLNDKK